MLEAASKYDRIALVAKFLEADIVGGLRPLPVVSSLAVHKFEVDALKGKFLEVHLALVLMTAPARSIGLQAGMALDT